MPAIDYFAPAPSEEERILRSIKGNYRREMVDRAIKKEGINAIPEPWKGHGIPEELKRVLGHQNPRARGGEDMPDLQEGEVEIARMSLLDSVHGEVTSLRARPASGESGILFRMVDEYETDFKLPIESSDGALAADQILAMFRDAEPSPMEVECEIGFQSYFYADLDLLATELGLK